MIGLQRDVTNPEALLHRVGRRAQQRVSNVLPAWSACVTHHGLGVVSG